MSIKTIAAILLVFLALLIHGLLINLARTRPPDTGATLRLRTAIWGQGYKTLTWTQAPGSVLRRCAVVTLARPRAQPEGEVPSRRCIKD